MRTWTAILFVVALLAIGGLLISQLATGQPLTLTSGYVPELDASQGFLFALAVGFLVISTIGMGVTLAILIGQASRQVAVNQAQLAGGASKEASPASAAKTGRQIKLPPLGPLMRGAVIAANVLVIAFVAYLTLDHYVLNPPAEPEHPVEQPGGEPLPPPPQPAGPEALEMRLAEMPAGNAANGEALFNAQPCFSCHSLQPDQVLVGPSLAGVGSRAAERRPGYSADVYLLESIIEPNAHVVEGFQSGLMPATFDQTLSDQDEADLIAYLKTLE